MALEDILVIDDEEGILSMLKEYLEQECGYSVVTSTRAMDALTKLIEKKFDVIISDINMPGMNGMELVMRVKASYPDVMIVMISAKGDAKNVVKAMKLGADDFIAKPFEMEDVAKCLKTLVRNRTRDYETAKEIKSITHSFGDYRILKQIGYGGMGVVYCAEQCSTGHVVALKILYPKLIKNEVSFQRFLREARLIGELDHPNIVKGIDVGRVEGNYFIAMELVDGKDLEDIIDDVGPFEVADAVGIIKQLFEVLQYMHSRNVIHRDIKPSNVLIAKGNVVKVADLGLTKHLDEKHYITEPGMSAGTVGYMPPEAIFENDPLDIRSDIYSLGCTIYFMLTGEHPYEGDAQHIFDVQRKYIPSARDINPGVPANLDAFIRKMMAVKREDRFQIPQEMMIAFHALGLVP